jgi:hypothetical protein
MWNCSAPPFADDYRTFCYPSIYPLLPRKRWMLAGKFDRGFLLMRFLSMQWSARALIRRQQGL